MSKNYLIIFVIVHICSGQKTDNLFSSAIVKSTRENGEGVTTQAYANAFAAAVNSITWVPYAVARDLGYLGPLPFLVSDTNNADVIEDFLTNFGKGSGNEDSRLSLDDLITKYGYPVEIHEVETEDYYVVTMFRIPSNGTAVFLMHGLLGSADDWVLAGRDSGLAYLLADAGYDVWLGNARGNKHSRTHINLKPSDASFWNFSWHEIGVYDLPAMIDCILNTTRQDSLKYIGHSQGTTAFFVMASEKPEYNNKVSLMIALSPVAFMSNVRSPLIRMIAPSTSILHGFSKSLGLYEFMPDNKLIRVLKIMICGTGTLAEILCGNIMFLMSGFDYSQLNITNLPVILGHIPSGASTKQFAHYGQGVLSEEFRKFDYGPAKNMKMYGAKEPPRYKLENVLAPVSLFYSEEDWLAHRSDVHKLYKHLAYVVDAYQVPHVQFNHLDFIMAKDVKALVYTRLINQLASFTGRNE